MFGSLKISISNQFSGDADAVARKPHLKIIGLNHLSFHLFDLQFFQE